DDRGAFRFATLGPGRYTLLASKAGFVSVSYGQKRPGSGRSTAAVVLTDGQRLDNLTMVMPRSGALSGVVTDEFGDPLLGAQVRALRYVMQSGRRTLTVAATAQSDDRGAYRLFDLAPGDYVVTVAGKSDRSAAEEQAMFTLMAQLQTEAAARARADATGSAPPA